MATSKYLSPAKVDHVGGLPCQNNHRGYDHRAVSLVERRTFIIGCKVRRHICHGRAEDQTATDELFVVASARTALGTRLEECM